MIHYLLVAVTFLLMLCVLVAAHELGHYLFARLFNMGVEEFAIGMGKRAKVWLQRSYVLPLPAGSKLLEQRAQTGDAVLEEVRSGMGLEGGSLLVRTEIVDTPKGPALKERTDFTFRWLPLGGFVRIKGMMPQEDGSETQVEGGFYAKAPWKRLVVLFAGPLFSVIAGVLLLIGLYMIDGASRALNVPVIETLSEGTKTQPSPAYSAGLRAGDRFVAINGKHIERFSEAVEIIKKSAGIALNVDYVRQGELRHTTLTPKLGYAPTLVPSSDPRYLELDEVPTSQGRIGIGLPTQTVRLSLQEAIAEALSAPAKAIKGLVRLVQQPSRFSEEAGGTIAMVGATSSAVEQGPAQAVWLAAMLSISVGIFNLLPIAPLDGGQMLIAFAELLRGGKRLSLVVQNALVSAGLVAVLALFVFAMFVDVRRLVDAKQEAPVVAPAPASK